MNRLLLVPALLLAACPLAAQTISTPAARQAALATAAKLGAPAAPSAPAVALNPFDPPRANLRPEGDPEEKRSDLSEADLVAALAAQLQPTGSLMLGGEPYLLFTERRQKIGDKVPVVLEKVEYTVEIVSIAGNRFRIRYNGREAERPIK